MKTRPFLVHALSPLHAGTGHAAEIIDLPIARMKATGIPIVPGSSIKGVLRDARRNLEGGKVEAVFGPSDDPSAHAGALVVGDARLLALPVRTFRGAFAWVTSPLLLTLAKRDLGAPGLPVPTILGRAARCTRDSVCAYDRGGQEKEKKVYLEDLDLPVVEAGEADAWAQLLAPLVAPDDDIFTKRFLIVDDETMAFLWDTATQIDARVRIDSETRTVADGALWLEESLPPETLLVGLFAADRSRRRDVPLTPDEVLDLALPDENVLQLGGKATVGRGRCRILPITAKAEGHGSN